MNVDIHKRSDIYNAFWIAWPQALGLLLMSVQSMVDIFWIGRLGTDEVAAVSLCGNVFNVVFGFAGFLHVGAIALLSRAAGARDRASGSHIFAQAFELGILSGILLIVGGQLSAPRVVGFFRVEPEVARLGVIYFRIMCAHLGVVMFIIAPMAAMNAAGDTLTPLVLSAVAVLANVILDPAFIFAPGEAVVAGGLVVRPGVFGMGVFGAGLASLAAAVIGFGLYAFTIPMGRFPLPFPNPAEFRPDWSVYWRIIRIGVPFAVAHMSRPLSTVLLLRIVAGFGTGAVAGFGISMRWYSVNWILAGGMGTAAAVLVGQHLGAGSQEGAARVSRRIIRSGLLIQAVLTALYFASAEALVGVMDPNPATIAPGAAFMRWVVAGFLLSTPGGLAASAMNGAGHTRPGMAAGVFSNWVVKLPLAFVLARYTGLSLDGVWVAMFISLIVEGALCLFWHKKGEWKGYIP